MRPRAWARKPRAAYGAIKIQEAHKVDEVEVAIFTEYAGDLQTTEQAEESIRTIIRLSTTKFPWYTYMLRVSGCNRRIKTSSEKGVNEAWGGPLLRPHLACLVPQHARYSRCTGSSAAPGPKLCCIDGRPSNVSWYVFPRPAHPRSKRLASRILVKRPCSLPPLSTKIRATWRHLLRSAGGHGLFFQDLRLFFTITAAPLPSLTLGYNTVCQVLIN